MYFSGFKVERERRSSRRRKKMINLPCLKDDSKAMDWPAQLEINKCEHITSALWVIFYDRNFDMRILCKPNFGIYLFSASKCYLQWIKLCIVCTMSYAFSHARVHVWPKSIRLHTYWSNIFAKWMHGAQSFTSCHQRCLLDLLYGDQYSPRFYSHDSSSGVPVGSFITLR